MSAFLVSVLFFMFYSYTSWFSIPADICKTISLLFNVTLNAKKSLRPSWERMLLLRKPQLTSTLNTNNNSFIQSWITQLKITAWNWFFFPFLTFFFIPFMAHAFCHFPSLLKKELGCIFPHHPVILCMMTFLKIPSFLPWLCEFWWWKQAVGANVEHRSDATDWPFLVLPFIPPMLML